jgi:hypothetical protein
MIGSAIIEKFNNLIGDSLDTDFALQLANDAKNSIETELQLEITKKLDSTGSVSAGQTSTTARSLPSDFFLPLTIYVGTQEVTPVPFEKQILFKDNNGKYWIDLTNDQYHLCGNQASAQTINFFYQYETPDIATGTSPVWPTRFHSIIPLEMAKQYWMIDAGEKNRSWDDRFAAEYQRMKNLMISWDAKLKLNAMDNSAFLDTSTYPSENRINL